MPIEELLLLAFAVFCVGALGAALRRNPLVLFMSIEMMFNAANLALVAVAREAGLLEGQAMALLALGVAAAEVAVGLAIIVAIFKGRRSVDVDAVDALKG